MPTFQVIYEHYQSKGNGATITQKKFRLWAENMRDAKETLETVKTMNISISKIHWETLQEIKVKPRLVISSDVPVIDEVHHFLTEVN
jgi:hypothetical protein